LKKCEKKIKKFYHTNCTILVFGMTKIHLGAYENSSICTSQGHIYIQKYPKWWSFSNHLELYRVPSSSKILYQICPRERRIPTAISIESTERISKLENYHVETKLLPRVLHQLGYQITNLGKTM